MSSARSITAARNRRAGDPSPKLQIQPPVRPVTSISSQSAFAQNGQQQQQQQQQNKGNNIRVSGKQSTVAQPKPSNGLPFSKLTISDAIGLVTLRLGRIEQFVMEVQENGLDSSSSNIPENSKLVDNSVLTSIINRLDSLEKKEATYANAIIEIEKCLPQFVIEDVDNADSTDNSTLLVQGLSIVGNNVVNDVVNDDSVTISAEI